MTRFTRPVLLLTVTVGAIFVARPSHAQLSMLDLGVPPGAVASYAEGINNRAQVVGIALTVSYDTRAFLWENGTFTDFRNAARGQREPSLRYQ
jgi:probable HAF family extracellular repeat protein